METDSRPGEGSTIKHGGAIHIRSGMRKPETPFCFVSLLPFLLILPPAFKELFLGSNIGGIFHELIALSEIELHSSILVPFLLHITIEDELFASNLKFRHVLLVGHFGVRTGKIFIVRSLSSNLEALDLSLEIIVVCPFGVELLRGVLCLL